MAVTNFASQGEERHLSILEIIGIKPVHYALGDNPDGYPGFVMEAARNASQDWTAQEDHSEEDTTIIRYTAVPTNLEIVYGLARHQSLGRRAISRWSAQTPDFWIGPLLREL